MSRQLTPRELARLAGVTFSSSGLAMIDTLINPIRHRDVMARVEPVGYGLYIAVIHFNGQMLRLDAMPLTHLLSQLAHRLGWAVDVHPGSGPLRVEVYREAEAAQAVTAVRPS